jgi:hypothetical protein
MAAAVSYEFARLVKWLRKEFVAILPVFLFFLVGFLLLILLIKLALAQVSVEVPVISNSVIGALLAAKAALILDETPLARHLEQHRRIVAVAVKTLFYGIATLLLGYIERVLDALHKVHAFDAAVLYVIEHASLYRILSWTLGISIVFALYFAFVEISGRMGGAALYALFFDAPNAASYSSEHSNSSARQRLS